MNTAADPLVHSPDGRVAGRWLDGVARFMGIPYAAAPVGARRLRSPQAPQPWVGVHDASRAGAASLQNLAGQQTWLIPPIEQQSEDCLFLNVFTPDLRGSAPVLLWVHGGQTRNGHGAAATTDGSALARQGLVVVTINYRLGALGGLAHPDLADDDTGLCANWGLQDKLAALAWVQRCIAAFGGDPARVTLAGQSSGAANVALIAQHQLGAGRYAQVILQSPPLFRPPMFVDLDAAAAYTDWLAQTLQTTVRGLRDVDGPVLQRAEQALATSPEVAARMGRPRTAPVLDGQLLRQWSLDAPPPSVPLLAGWTASESDFWFKLQDGQGRTLSPQTAPVTQPELHQRTAALLKLHHAFAQGPDADTAVAAAMQQAGSDEPAAVWRALYTDLVFRAPIVHLLSRTAAAGTPAWGYEFAHPIASAAGGTPHAADVPFVFGTQAHPHVADKIGNATNAAASAAATSQAVMQAWSDFVRRGTPAAAADWPRFGGRTPAVCRFDAGGARQITSIVAADAARRWPGYAPVH